MFERNLHHLPMAQLNELRMILSEFYENFMKLNNMRRDSDTFAFVLVDGIKQVYPLFDETFLDFSFVQIEEMLKTSIAITASEIAGRKA